MSNISNKVSINVPIEEVWESPSLPWIDPPVCDEESLEKVTTALTKSGFQLGTKFKIVRKHSCTFCLSMRSPREGDITPEEDAIRRLGDGIGPDSIASIQGTSLNGLMGKSMTLFNGGTICQWYMARILNPFGEGTVNIPIQAKIQIIDSQVGILCVLEAEMPFE